MASSVIQEDGTVVSTTTSQTQTLNPDSVCGRAADTVESADQTDELPLGN